jgi:hypothetical protein
MKRRSAICAAALAGLLAIAAGGCATTGRGEPIEVHVVQLAPLPSTAFEHRLRIDLRLTNPRNHDYEIEGMRFVLEVNGRRLATGVSNEPVKLPRLGEVVVPITTTTDLLDVVNQIVAFGRQPQPTFEYAVRGKIYLKGLWGSLSYEHRGSEADLLPRSTPASTAPPGRRG